MTVITSFSVSGLLGRDNDYVLHPIDQYPIKIDSDYLHWISYDQNKNIWYEEKSYLWVKAAFDKTGYWEYRLKKVN